MSNTINVTACDNELLFIAYQWGASFEIASLFSGNENSVDVTIPITANQYQGGVKLNGVNNALTGSFPINLASGDYSLVAIGINTGGPQNFSFTFNGQTYSSPQNSDLGVVYKSDPIAFTVE